MTTSAHMTTSAQTVAAPARARTATAAATVRRKQGFQHGGWFVAPFLALFALFVIWPLLRGLYLSFTDANISGDGASFVGLDNYREALNDRLMWDSLGHSAYFTLLVVPVHHGPRLPARDARPPHRARQVAVAAVLLRAVPAALHGRRQPVAVAVQPTASAWSTTSSASTRPG